MQRKERKSQITQLYWQQLHSIHFRREAFQNFITIIIIRIYKDMYDCMKIR